jgi:hypothetical protein
MPTVLDAAGIDRRGLRLDGVSLSEPGPDRIVQSENEWQRALVGRGGYLLSDKEVVYDGYEYYFDARQLLSGDRLWDTETGREMAAGPSSAPELFAYMDILTAESDPKERRIKSRDRYVEELTSTVRRQSRGLKSRDEIIAFKERVIANRDRAIANRDAIIAGKKREIDSVLNSSSWKLTYPLRWLSAILKGQRPLN